VEVWVKSKRITVDGGKVSEEDGGANCHWRAALRARSAKNWLDAGASSSAEETLPSGLSCTRTLTRTLPRMVERAFSETTGRTLRWMDGGAIDEAEPVGFTFAGA
jgi:hypothetical protein